MLEIEYTLIPIDSELTKKGLEERQVWQGDCGLRNFIKNNEEDIFIINIDTIGYNLSMLDLIKFLKSLQWDKKLIKNALNGYLKKKELSNMELEALFCLLDLPQEFVSYIDKFYRKKEQVFLDKLRNFLDDTHKREECLNFLREYFLKNKNE